MRRFGIPSLAIAATVLLGACSASPATGVAAPAAPASPPPATSSPTTIASASAARSPGPRPTASPATAAPATDADPGTLRVTIEDFAFQPAAVEAAVGDVVSWTNEDGEPHTVRSEDGSISSPIVAATPYEWTVAGTPGTEVAYSCSIHPSMQGRVKIGD